MTAKETYPVGGVQIFEGEGVRVGVKAEDGMTLVHTR